MFVGKGKGENKIHKEFVWKIVFKIFFPRYLVVRRTTRSEFLVVLIHFMVVEDTRILLPCILFFSHVIILKLRYYKVLNFCWVLVMIRPIDKLHCLGWESSINDAMLFWGIFTPPPPRPSLLVMQTQISSSNMDGLLQVSPCWPLVFSWH